MTRFEALKAAHERKIQQNPTQIIIDRTGLEYTVRLVPGGRAKQQVSTAAGTVERAGWTMLLPAGVDVVASTSTTPETFVTVSGAQFEVWSVRHLVIDAQEWGIQADCVEMS